MLRSVFRFLFSLIVAFLAVVLTVGLVLAFNRDWQRDLVESALERRTGLQWSIEKAWFARPDHFRAEEVFALKGIEGVEVGVVDLRFDLGRSLGTEEIVVAGGRLERLVLDLSTMPPEALGLTAAQLARGTPGREATLAAVSDLTEFALMRVEAAGLTVELNDLAVDGVVLLPGGRQLRFSQTIQHAVSGDTAEMRLSIHAAEYR
jgi:hypothetical protein